MKQTLPLCVDCRKDLQATGYKVRQISEIVDRITCGICGQDTYGGAFTVTKGEEKGGKS